MFVASEVFMKTMTRKEAISKINKGKSIQQKTWNSMSPCGKYRKFFSYHIFLLYLIFFSVVDIRNMIAMIKEKKKRNKTETEKDEWKKVQSGKNICLDCKITNKYGSCLDSISFIHSFEFHNSLNVPTTEVSRCIRVST